MLKKNRPKLELRAAPDKGSALICTIEPTASKEVLQLKGNWQFVRVKVDNRSCMGWVRTRA